MTQKANNTPTQIVAFDATYKLTAIFKSISEASAITGALRQSLIKAAYGDIISVKGKYWRAVPADFQIEPDDLDSLTLFEFDETVGIDRKIYGTRSMIKGSAILESEYLEKIKNGTN